VVPDITGMAGAVFPPLPEILQAVAVIIILPAHTSTVARQAITGTAVNAWPAAMKVQVGQTRLPDPNPGANLPQAAVALILIGIMAVVPAAQAAPIMAAVELPVGIPVPVVLHPPADAAPAGGIPDHARANSLRRRDVITSRHQAAAAVGTLIQLPALAVKVQPADQPVLPPQEVADHPLPAPVLQVLIG